MITVKDVWRGALPAGTELVVGHAGLERQVDWATSLRTRPPAFEAVKGGELAFIAVRSIRLLDERLDLLRVLESFAEKGGVAAAVVGEVGPDSVAAADRLRLPLLRLPEPCHLADVARSAIAADDFFDSIRKDKPCPPTAALWPSPASASSPSINTE